MMELNMELEKNEYLFGEIRTELLSLESKLAIEAG